MKCDICGKNDVIIIKMQGAIKIPFGSDAVYEKTLQSCNACGEAVDITPDDVRIQAIKEAERKTIKPMIEYITSEEYSAVAIERIFQLPYGTLAKWSLIRRGDDITPEGLALLRLIRALPPLIHVAENNYATALD